jgi:hypothetical protein
MTTVNSASGAPGAATPVPMDVNQAKFQAAAMARNLVLTKFQALIKNFDASDVDQIMLTLAQLRELTSEVQGTVSSDRIQQASEERREASKKMLGYLQDAFKKAAEAMARQSGDKVWAWAGAIGGAVVSILALASVVATGGATGPLAFSAGLGLVASIHAMTDMGLKQNEVKDASGKQVGIGFDDMVNAIVAQQIEDGTIVVIRQDPATGAYLDARKDDSGNYISNNVIEDPHKTARPGAVFMTDATLNDWKMGWSVTVNVILAVMMLSSAAGAEEFAAKGAGAASSASALAGGVGNVSRFANVGTLQTVAAGIQVVGDVMQTVAGVMQGVTRLEVAELDKDNNDARAWKTFYESTVKRITQRLQDAMQSLQQTVKDVADTNDATSQYVQEVNDNQRAIGQAVVVHS